MSWSHRPALDGLRFLAVYLVLAFHGGLGFFAGGFVGVDFFFVLSGFLVTSILLEELAASGRLDLGRFYARRVRRLLPAAVLVIVATCAVSLLVVSPTRRVPFVGDAQSALLYVANWRFLGQSNDYFATDFDKSPFLHFWSLSIEEQFYFIFPLALVALFWLRRRFRHAVVVGLVVLLVASLASQLFWSVRDVNHAYYGTDARLYQLLAGSLAAVGYRELRTRKLASPRLDRTATVLAWAGLVATILIASSVLDAPPAWRGILATLSSIALILGVAINGSQPVAAVFSLSGITYLGRISYGTYLWHWPVILVLKETLRTGPVVITLLAAGIATAFAALSYELLEMPIRRSRTLAPMKVSTVLVGLTASALVAVTVVPQILESQRRPVIAQATSANASSVGHKIPDGINWNRYIDDRGTPETQCSGVDTSTCTAAEGDGPTVLLVGDSHGSMLAPTLTRIAEDRDWTLLLDIQGACPWQLGLYNAVDSPAEQQSCLTNRKEAYGELIADAGVDLVVLTGLPRDDEAEWGDVILAEKPDGADETLNERLLRTTDDTLAALNGLGVHTLIFESIIVPPDGFDPLDCLSASVDSSSCVVPVNPQPISDAIYRTAATRSDQVWTLNINDFACPRGPVCDPLQGRMPVWRDPKHYTPRILMRHRADIDAAIADTGALDGLD